LPPRVYFYRDENNVIKKFIYCCRCGAGPFKESEKNYKYLSTWGNDRSNYCVPCAKTMGLTLFEIEDKSLLSEKEKIEKK